MPNIQNKQGFKSKINTFRLATHYQLQKNFSKIELSLRQGCQLFTVYVFGSFCWLYLIRYSNKTNELFYSKDNFLFQDILFETLPLFSTKGSVVEKTKLNSSLTSKKPLNYFDTQTNFKSNTDGEFVNIELTPFFSEKLQNYIGRKNLNFKSDRLLCSPKELVFFSRKPLFIKVKTKSKIVPKMHLSPLFFTSKKLENQKLVNQAFRNRIYSPYYASYIEQAEQLQPNNLFLKKQILTQKKVYTLSGTSMIMDPEIDFLPRKLEECVSFSKKGSSVLLSKEENKKPIKDVFSLNFKPQLSLNESLFWCNLIKRETTGIFLESEKLKTIKIAKSWVTHNSFEPNYSQSPLSFSEKNAQEGDVFVTSLVANTRETLCRKNQHKYRLFQKTKSSTSDTKQSPIVFEEFLQENFFLKKRGFWKSKNQFMDILNQPRLASGFHFPNALIVQNKKEKLKEGLGLTIKPRLIFFKENSSLAPQRPFLTKKIEEKDFFKKNTFLEWLYEPHPLAEYLCYSRANNKLLNLQKRAPHFTLLDKHTDLKTRDCFLNKKLFANTQAISFIDPSATNQLEKLKDRYSVRNKYDQPIAWNNPFAESLAKASQKMNFFGDTQEGSRRLQKVKFLKEKTFIERFFSYKRNAFCGLLDAPENFFGTPYLKLGERCTIEKLKSKTKIATLYSIHSGGVDGTAAVQNKPYASMGTSLKTVFGKKQFTTSQNQNSKKISKVQNLITNARLVTNWSIEPLTAKNFFQNSYNQKLKENHLFFSNPSTTKDDHLLSVGNKSFVKNAMLNKVKISQLFNFNRISGKANRNINFPFKYYNPGIKRERNIEDTMLILEGYKKSRLFPLIHNNFRGIAARNLPSTIELDNISYTDQDVDLQSILGGMRQRTEKQRIAESVSEPSEASRPKGYWENRTTSKEKNQEKEEESIKVLSSFSGKQVQQNKKLRLSNYYPLCTSLAVCPQEALPQKSLGTTSIVELKSTHSFDGTLFRARTKELKGSIQTKGFYFEKLIYSQPWPFLAWPFGPRRATPTPFLKFLNKENFFLIAPNFLAKIIFFACTWYSYKLLARPLSQSTQFLPATFTEAIGLESFQQKYRIIKGEKTKLSFSFKNIAGAEKTLSQLRDLIWTFRLIGTGSPNGKKNLFTFFPYIGSRFGQSRSSVFTKSRNRLLLAGPPGTGKTLLVKALAAEANLPVIVQPVSSLRMISGVENPVSALFHVARQIKPCIIFLDELDTLGNDVNLSTNNSTAEQKLGIRLARKYTYTLLLELDGLTSSTRDLLIIGATNRPETLNPALTRAGRFDTILDFHLPSQEIRTALFSFYLGTEQAFQHSKKGKIKSRTKAISLKKINFNLKKSKKKSFWLESYLAGKCSGLSHASIGTIINESALESMLVRSIAGDNYKPLHTLETLDRAINSIKTLTSRVVQNPNTLSFSMKKKNKTNPLTLQLKGKRKQKNQNFFRQAEEGSNLLGSFQPEFLVNRVYQVVGSLIFNKKNQEKNNKNSSFKKARKSFYKTSWCGETSYEGTQRLSLKSKGFDLKPLISKKSHLFFKQKGMPINRKDLQNLLLQEYSGVASLALYTVAKPLTFKIITRAGLYQDPNYVAAILLTLRILTLQNSFSKECIIQGKFLEQSLNKKSAKEEKTGPTSSITKENFGTFSGFVSERNLPKVVFPNASNLQNPLAQSSNWPSLENQKSILFWKNRKVLKNSFSSFTRESSSFTKHHKEAPQTLLMDLKTVNDLITGWFRVYFSRPFFRYDTFHYIENKEYYPKNNYILKPNRVFQRNVSTLSHTTHSSESNLTSLMLSIPKEKKISSTTTDFTSLTLKNSIKTQFFTPELTERKGKLWSADKLQRNTLFSSSITVSKLGLPNLDQLALDRSKKAPITKVESQIFYETKETLYLALVSSIFHKGIQFFQKNRELTDYCAYCFLRYGVLYDFSLETICKNF